MLFSEALRDGARPLQEWHGLMGAHAGVRCKHDVGQTDCRSGCALSVCVWLFRMIGRPRKECLDVTADPLSKQLSFHMQTSLVNTRPLQEWWK